MIFEARHRPEQLQSDICVVGSGAGGAMVAMVAAEAGLRVLVLEAGEFLTPDDMTQREEAMLPRLYWDAAGRTTDDRRIRVHQGKGVGGSTLHNLNLCKRIPEPLLRQWAAQRALGGVLDTRKWDALYTEVEAMLEVSEVPRDRWDPELIGWYLRTAYSQGYADALSYIDRAELRDELQRIDDARPEAA